MTEQTTSKRQWTVGEVSHRQNGSEWICTSAATTPHIDGKGTAHWAVEFTRIKAPAKVPSIATMERWVSEGVAKATDGCRVEPDGTCEHGKPSWLLKLGLI